MSFCFLAANWPLELKTIMLIVKFQEFEPVIQKPYTIVYFHSAASLQL